MKIPKVAVQIAVQAVNADQPELSYVEHVLHTAKKDNLFDGSLQSAITILRLNGFEVGA